MSIVQLLRAPELGLFPEPPMSDPSTAPLLQSASEGTCTLEGKALSSLSQSFTHRMYMYMLLKL